MANLERRIDVLERGAQSDDEVTVIAIQLVNPGDLRPANRFCKIDGVTYTCGTDESPSEFDARMVGVAKEQNRRLGAPIRIICSPTDFDL